MVNGNRYTLCLLSIVKLSSKLRIFHTFKENI